MEEEKKIIHEFNFEEWLNKWGDCSNHQESKSEDGKISNFAKGYHQAIRDVGDKLNMKLNADLWLKNNLVRLAEEHKKNCNNPECNIQLVSLALALKRLRIKLTEKDMEIFC